MPSMIPDQGPDPLHWAKTCTEMTSASLATPKADPTAVLAQCVPCELSKVEQKFESSITPSHTQSPVPSLQSPALQPAFARPSKSSCEIRIPVSRTYTLVFEPVVVP